MYLKVVHEWTIFFLFGKIERKQYEANKIVIINGISMDNETGNTNEKL